MNVFRKAADWLEDGRPGERSAAVEAAEFGELLWDIGGWRARQRQDGDVYRLSLIGGDSVLSYRIVGVEGGWLR
ncbi:hypothetical protein [Streptomyces scabiei]|uniref:hypothetical protein n=1 Tax=Streptomyces scabiei TaxID=1930 RepID=UPI0004E6E3B5|nr:hypothetical protein [Streptomyces scabiei]KFG05598.1 hypothetical protein IQ61_29365 [Streptomyces scabiei]MDX2829450.1 hypothetical protein [Streptomyces scabiei]MDX3674994.1 hypothetical protein [Streptomyces scabiei]